MLKMPYKLCLRCRTILDLTGKVIGVNTPNFFENKMEVTVPVHNLANGVYKIVLYGLNGDIVGGIFIKM